MAEEHLSMTQHCLQCDRPMHLRGGDMTTTCAECREAQEYELLEKELKASRGVRMRESFDCHSEEFMSDLERRSPDGTQILSKSQMRRLEHQLPRSEAHDLDARALKANLHTSCEVQAKQLAQIVALKEKVQKLENVVSALDGHSLSLLLRIASDLKEKSGEAWAIGEMVERAVRAVQ